MAGSDDHLYDLVLKQSDIVEGQLPIPGIQAETHFSKFRSSSGENLAFNQSFVDIDGKNWVFQLSSFFGISYAFTDGWGQFVKDKGLVAGDTVSFWRMQRKHGDGFLGDDDTGTILVGYKKGDRVSGTAHQVFDVMPQSSLSVLNLGASEQTSSCSSPTSSVTTTLCLGENSLNARRSILYGSIGSVSHHGGQKSVAEVNSGIGGMKFSHHSRKMNCTAIGCKRAAQLGTHFCKAHKDMDKKAKGQSSDMASQVSEVTDVGEHMNFWFSDWSGMNGPLSLSVPHQPVLAQGASSNLEGLILQNVLHFCSLYPSDHWLDKVTLVQLWIAHGIFGEKPREKNASLFFDDCKKASLFFDDCVKMGYFEFNRTYVHKPMYKFNGDASLVIPKEIVRIEGNSNLNDVPSEATHLSIRCCKLRDFNFFRRFNQLKTLIFLQGQELNFKQVPRDFFLLLKHLRILDLSDTHLTELPSSIGCMECLCFLDLSRTPIKRLPETLDCLVKLQTLKLKACSNLSVLPKGMRKLVNLRHLDFDVIRQLTFMPKGMGDLTELRTLSAFLVGLEGGCSIKQLKNMNCLSGSFCISRLENVFTKDDADEACLSNKSQIKKLELHWTQSNDGDVVGYGEVLSSLQPSKWLEELKISCYGGFELPSWICERAFSKLVHITLFEFENCLVLPSLGQLPSLKILELVGFHKLKTVGHNFYGGLQGYNDHNFYGGLQKYNAFPMLESLTVENMFSLEEWTGIKISNFPRLLKLTVKYCPKLHTLCSLSSICSLKNLEIIRCEVLASCLDDKLSSQMETFIMEDCPLISKRFLGEGGQDWLKVAHIQSLWIDHQEISYSERSSQGDAE